MPSKLDDNRKQKKAKDNNKHKANQDKEQNLSVGKNLLDKNQRKKTAADGFNEPDDDDEEGMTRFNDRRADYTGLAMSNAEQEKFLMPDLLGIEASEAQLVPFKNKKNKRVKQNHKETATDDIKPNQDPHSEKSEDITLGRSNSSANTTSSPALTSSGAKTLL